MKLDLPEIVDALLAISEWPWSIEPGKGGDVSILDADKELRVLVYPKSSAEGFDPTNRDFVASSPVWLASLVVALVEEKANHLCWINRKYGPLAEFIPTSLRSFNIDPVKYAELKKRLESVRPEGK